MNPSKPTIEFKFERTIPAPPNEVFDAWLNPKVPGNPWNAAEKFVWTRKWTGCFTGHLRGRLRAGADRGVREVNERPLD